MGFAAAITGLYACSSSTVPKESNEKYYWRTYRGVNVGCDITEVDVADLSATGANLMRLSMPVCTFMELEEPYAYRKEAFEVLDSVLNWAEKYDMSVLIDPHRYPGTLHRWTMLGNDPFWKEFKYHDLAIQLWDTLAQIGAKRGSVIAGYDLLNEPEVSPQMVVGSPGDINLLYSKLTKTIRKWDDVHTIVYALPRYYVASENKMYPYHKGIQLMAIPVDDNICLETHTYMPMAFTHQNIWEEGPFIPYPSEIDSIYWNYDMLVKDQVELINFSKANPKVPILVGEFSCPRWTGQDGIRYLRDVIDISEQYGWSWAYHAYRENQVWDPEMPIDNRADSTRVVAAPRMVLLQSYFEKN